MASEKTAYAKKSATVGKGEGFLSSARDAAASAFGAENSLLRRYALPLSLALAVGDVLITYNLDSKILPAQTFYYEFIQNKQLAIPMVFSGSAGLNYLFIKGLGRVPGAALRMLRGRKRGVDPVASPICGDREDI